MLFLEYRSISRLEASHGLFHISNGTIESFHLVIVVVALDPDVIDMSSPKTFVRV